MSDERDRDSIEADLAALLRDSVTGDVGWKSTDTCRLELETKVIRSLITEKAPTIGREGLMGVGDIQPPLC